MPERAAAKNAERYIVELEQRPTTRDIVALVIGVAALGFLGGVAAAKVLPTK